MSLGRQIRLYTGRMIRTFPGWSNKIFRKRLGDAVRGRPRDILGTNICRLGCSLDFRNISCLTCKHILSKVVLKYHVSMLSRPSVVSQNPFRIIRAVNPLSQLDINQKFQNYISVSICHCHRAPFMNPLFITYKNDEWCHFGVCLGAPALISFYCVCVVYFYFSLFSYIFVQSTTC